jgi:hypothetical protein
VEETRAAGARVYGEVVTVDTFHNPFVIAGDFNGDGSQDICVFVNPVKERLGEINSEVAGWMIKAPLAEAAASDAVRSEVKEQDRKLMAVIHGYGPAGWRDPEARQTYLLKNAAGLAARARPAKSVPRPDKKPFPYIRGDVISETLNNEQGLIYYDGAKYVWHGPRSYRGEVARRLPH